MHASLFYFVHILSENFIFLGDKKGVLAAHPPLKVKIHVLDNNLQADINSVHDVERAAHSHVLVCALNKLRTARPLPNAWPRWMYI